MDDGLLLPFVLTDRMDGVALFSLFLKSPNMLLIEEEEEEEEMASRCAIKANLFITLRRLFNQTLKITLHLLINIQHFVKLFVINGRARPPLLCVKWKKKKCLCVYY